MAKRKQREVKDLDEIDYDLKENSDKLLHQEPDPDKPGEAQYYCIHCARYFVDDFTLQHHFRTKAHKKRLKRLEPEPYTVEDSDRAAGHGSLLPPSRRKIQTQPTD